MKKCSTAALWLSVVLVTSALPAAAREPCEFLASAPDVHRVIPGDTLWDLATTFLKNPWCWPAVWEHNREQVGDPHLIYPGQLIRLDRRRHRLSLVPAAGPADERLSPMARSLPTEDAAVPALDPKWQRFASQLRLVSPRGAGQLPRLLGFAERRRIAGPGDLALVGGQLQGGSGGQRKYQLLRMLPPVVDPEDGSVLAVPLQLAGSANYLHSDEGLLHRFRIIDSRHELVAGDLLVPALPDARPMPVLDWRPAPPFEGKVAAVLHGGRWAAQHDLVALNRGQRDGLAPGKLVVVLRQVRIAPDESRQPDPPTEQAFATLLVLDALERVSLALVLRSDDAISVGDRVRSTGQERQ